MIDDDEQILKRQRPLGDAVGDALAYGTLRDRKDFNWVDIKSGAAMMSYRHSIATTASDEGSCDANNNNLLSADNLLRLALKKPKSWKWELTTSSSSPNISFPKIQLYDGVSGELMVEVDQPDCVIRSDGSDVGRVPAEQSVLLQSSSSSRELDTRPGRYRRSRTSLVKEKLSTSGESLADIFNQLQNKGLGHKLSTSGSQYRLINGADVEDGRGSLQKSKSANAIGVPDAPPIIRRRSRRSLASRSSSILERISEFYGRSSTEEDDGRDLQLVVPAVPQLVLPAARDDPPAQPDADGVTIEEIPAEPSTTPIKPRPKIYKLVRSNIGTLMVREESFHTQSSLRRRQRENGELPSTAPDSERLVELDGRTERPRPMDNGEGELFRYEREINHIDGLLSRVMLSHDLQTEDIRQDAPSIRISRPPEVATPVNGSTPYQNGTTHRKRRSRRSVSVGASVNSPHRRSLSSERNHSPTNPYRPGQRNGRRSASSSSTSDTELGPKSEEHRTGSSSRSGSQKRRGRTRHRGGQSNDTPDSSSRAAISNGDQLISRTGEPECQRQSLPERTESSSQPNSFTGGKNITAPCKGEPVRKPPQTITLSHDVSDQAELRPLVSERAVVRSKGKSGSNVGSNTTVSSFLADSYNASDKVLQKLVQSLGRSLNTRKRDRLEAKRKGGSSWLRHVPGCCSGSGKSVSPPARDSIVLRTGTCLRYRNERNRLPSVTTDNLLDRNTPSTGRQITSTDQEDERAFGGEYGIADERFLPPAGNGTSDRFIFDRLQLEFPVVEPAVELICYQHHSTDEDEDDDDDDSYDNDTNEYEHDDPRVPACGERTCALQRSASERTDRNRRTRTNMGANVSSSARQHAKGLTSGRRAQSIDNLKSDTTQYFHQYHNNNNGDTFHHQTFLADTAGSNADGEGLEKQPPPPDLACLPGTGQIPPEQQQHQQDHVIYVSRKDRNKFCGSLPNHLDLDASTIDRDCEAIVKQNEFLQANLKNVQQHQQQQQQQTATRTGCNQTGGPNPSPPNGSQQQLTFGGSVPVDHTTAGSQQQLQNLPPQLPTYQQHQDSPLHCSSTATQGPPNTSGPGGVGLVDGVGGSTFRSSEACGSGQQQQVGTIAANLQLKLPLHRTAIDAGCDQGYGSERSPEDDLPPPLLLMHETQYIEILASSSSSIGSTAPCQQLPVECVGSSTAPLQQGEQQHTQPCWTHSTNTGQLVVGPYSFITKDSIFFVQVSKGSRGLGFSVSGGTDSSAPYPGLIRIKRLFPHQAAWATGMLQPGDILLEANGVPLTGLTNYLALEVLRKATNVVTLTVCRPKDEQYRKLSPPTEPPRPPLRNALSYEQGQGSNSVPQSPLPAGIPFQHQQQQIHHFFPPPNARNPQLQTVGGYLPSHDPMQTSFSGEFEIVLTKQQGSLGFTLRKEDESVLGHYVRALVREPALSDGRIRPGDKIVAVNDVPVSSMSHEEAVIFLRQAADVVRLRLYRDQAQTPLSAHSPIESSLRGRTRLLLRPEAINLLTDLAANRFHRAAAGSGSSVASSHTNSPRRLRRVGAHQAGFDNHGFQQQQQQQQQHSNDTFNYSDSCSNASTIVSQAVDDLDDAYYCDEEIDAIVASEDRTSGGEEHGPRPRPTFLDLEAGTRFQLGSGGTTVQQLNNLDRDTLNAPLRYGLGGGAGTPGLAGPDPDGANFVSLPCETFLVACKTEQDLQQAGDQTEAIYVQHFAHKSPLYSSVNVPARVGAAELVDAVERGGKKSLMKWKGATLLGDEEERHEPEKVADLVQEQQDTLVTPDADDSSLAATAGTTLSTATPTTERELFDLNASCGTDSEGNQIFTVELNKGWNSRLGFSLKQDTGANGSIRTVISAIYRDSVAARDGRLRVGDVLIMVNEESVEAVPTAQVIELMRIVRGAIFITLLRPSGAGGAEGTLEPTPEEPTSVEPSGNVTPVHSSDYVAVGNRDASNATSSTVKKQEETSDPTEVSTEGQ